MANVLEVASKLRSDIGYFVDLTVEEHLTQTQNKEADEVWKDIVKGIDTLVREAT